MPDLIEYQRSRAILIGVSVFADTSLKPVPATMNSVARMREMLIAPHLGGWPEERVHTFTDPVASGAFAADLLDLVKTAEDALIFYFVGHGVMSDLSELCLVLSDTREGHAETMGLPYSTVRKILAGSPARVKTVILDCCHSGQAATSLGGGAIADATREAGITTLTAADYAAHVVPFEQQQDACTSFTATLLELVHAGKPGGGEVLTVQELFLLLRSRLANEGLPEPGMRTTDTAALFPLAHNAARASAEPGDSAAAQPPGAAAEGKQRALVVWRREGRIFYDQDGRVYGGDADLDANQQLEADRKWWPIARHRMPELRALVFIVNGVVSHIREVFGVDEAETGDSRQVALEVSPPLTGTDLEQRLPGLPVTVGDSMPAVQGKLREYLVW